MKRGHDNVEPEYLHRIAGAEALAWHALGVALVAGALFTVVFLTFGPELYAELGT